jgi:alpha-beta hydrolase superfamily lysophospholipase
MRRMAYIIVALLLLAPAGAGLLGHAIGPGLLHPMRLNAERLQQTEEMLKRTGATKQDFNVRAPDGVELRGWKIRPPSPKGDWVLLFHGVSDNRTGVLGHAEFLLRHGYSVVMMDSRAHGESGGDMATYGWKERYDTVAVVDALYHTERVAHLDALGVSMGAAIALQSAAVEPRIEGVVAEDPFEDLREVSYDYAGLHFSPFLGETLFRPASIFAMESVAKAGGFNPDEVSPEKSVALRPFAVLLICGTRDSTIPCRHAKRIYRAASGPKELWIVDGAAHASALGHAPAEYERRVVRFFDRVNSGHQKGVVNLSWRHLTAKNRAFRNGESAMLSRLAGSESSLRAGDFVGDQNGFRDFLHRLAALPALVLQHELSLFFVDLQIAPQNVFSAFNRLPRLRKLERFRALGLQPHRFNLGPHEETDRRDQMNFAPAVRMGLAVLHVDDSDEFVAAKHRHRQKRLVPVLRQIMKQLKSRIERGAAGDRHRFFMLADPASDALPHPKLQTIHHVRMRILRRPQDEFASFKDVDETRIALHYGRNNSHDQLEHRGKRIGGGDALPNLMQHIDVPVLFRHGVRVHTSL